MTTSESRSVALENLKRAAARSKRTNVAYPRFFFRTDHSVPDAPAPTPPLAQLIQGGRGGAVRLRLYLMLTMMATREPYDIRNPPVSRVFARTLDLPSTTGPRRINDNFQWLEEHHFIDRTVRPGKTAAIQLLDPTDPKHGPLTNPRQQGPWVTVPIGFWSQGWILELSPVGIAVLFALLERLGGEKGPRFLTKERRASYELSHDTWTKGRQELEDWSLLKVRRVPDGDDFTNARLRNTYWVEKDKLDLPTVPFRPGGGR